jgi:adenine deaminase
LDKGAASIKCIADLLIKNGLLVDPLRETAERMDLSIKDGRILALSDSGAREVIDAEGCYVSCGFIESHLHVEGLHLLPGHYFRAFLAHGTTTIVTDLHEIANAGGMYGLRWYLSLIDEVPLDLFVMAPSCVPSSPHERGAAKIGAGDLRRLREMRRVIGLGEVMDMRAVMRRQKTIMRKIALFEGKPVDGHAPGLTGDDLDLYMSAGIYSDHESTSLREGREKLKRGMHLFLRQGSVARDLDKLLPLVRPANMANLSLCTDDLSSKDLYESGHLDRLVSRLVQSKVPLFRALRLVTGNPAAYFNLNDRNAPVPGRKADLVVFDNPAEMHVKATVKNGKVVYREGEDIGAGRETRPAPASCGLNVAPFRQEDLRRKATEKRIRAIGVREGTIITDDLAIEARTEDGYLIADHERDFVFAYVFDRYRADAAYGSGLVHGFALKDGALGTTYAHDSHNLLIVGDNGEDIYEVFCLLRACGGGMAASCRGSGLVIPMPYFGIISHLDAPALRDKERGLDGLVRRMGVRLLNPFFQMSFLSLPVIPALRLTTKGLFHVGTSRYVE